MAPVSRGRAASAWIWKQPAVCGQGAPLVVDRDVYIVWVNATHTKSGVVTSLLIHLFIMFICVYSQSSCVFELWSSVPTRLVRKVTPCPVLSFFNFVGLLLTNVDDVRLQVGHTYILDHTCTFLVDVD